MRIIKNKYYVAVIIGAVALICFWFYMNRPDTHSLSGPRFTIPLDSVNHFFPPDRDSKMLKVGQLIEIEGRVHEVNTLNDRRTIVLKGKMEGFPYIICDMKPEQERELELIKKNDTIKLKGVFKGSLKDVVLLNCQITHHNLYE